MTRVEAIYDGTELAQTVVWEDGTLTVTPPSVEWAVEKRLDSPPTPTGLILPEGPSVEISGWRTDPWAFVAGANTVMDSEPTRWSMQDMPDPGIPDLPAGAV